MPKQNSRITYILINGPKAVGKTEIIQPTLSRILDNYYTVANDSFAAPMKQYIATGLGMQYANMKKDIPIDVLSGYSVREFLIDLSEEYMKVRYGEDIFARLLHYRTLRQNPLPSFVISDDCGFDVERDALPNTLTIRVERPGHDYTGDSRNYLSYPDYTIVNDGSVEQLRFKIKQLGEWIIAKRNTLT